MAAATPVAAQETQLTTPISGTVIAQDTGLPMPGAVVTAGAQSAITDENGAYSIDVAPGTYTLKVLLDGYQEWVQEVTVEPRAPLELDIQLIPGEVIVIVDVGSRTQRTQLETPVPVDVIPEEMITRSAHSEANQILSSVVPSYNATHQTISDGTDHINPASLRGLGPDQVLVLVNGKRRHPSALVNVNGTFGRGTVGTDLNSIPADAIKRVEILRDGASAQYGSDAIAGVVNIVLKDHVNVADFTARTGITGSSDGEEYKASANWGYKLGDDGFLNLSAEFLSRGRTNRAGPWTGQIFPGIEPGAQTDAELARRGKTREDYSMKVGQSAALVGMLYFNTGYALADNIDVYASGGITRRKGYATGFYRLPYQTERVDLTLYPDGFLPEINPLLHDWSISGGVKGELAGLGWDLSATHGGNSFHYFIDNSMNASLGSYSPTSFDAGKLQFYQTTVNADLIKPIDALESMSLVLGAEARFENYQIIAGERASWVAGPETYIEDGVEKPKTPGAQVFPGFQPANEVDELRESQSAYLGVESEINDQLMVDVTGRFERYSDFGNTLNGKLAARYKVTGDVALRGGVSTGFRAPSLHQVYFNSTSTQFVENPETQVLEPKQVLTARNNSEVAAQFGIPALEEETSLNASAGLTAQLMDNLSLTADVYQILIDDRIVLSSRFAGNPNAEMDTLEYQVAQLLADFQVSQAQFFMNAVDSTTRGMDLVLNYDTPVGDAFLSLMASANLTKTEVTAVNIPQSVADKFTDGNLDQVEDKILNREEQNRLETALPRQKGSLSANYKVGKISLMGRAHYYGPVEYWSPSGPELDEEFGAKVIFDADVGYRKGKWLFSVGANNLFNTFPDKQVHPENVSGNRFIYSRRVSQFGINGGFYYLRLKYMH